jgi:presequence protease
MYTTYTTVTSQETAIAASLNSAEFELREFNTGSFPRGLSLMLGAVSNWIYNRDPTEELHFEKPLEQLKAELKSGVPVFQKLVKELLVDNGHRYAKSHNSFISD